jgi:hypothetical protein
MRVLHIDDQPFWTVPYLNAGRNGKVQKTFLPVYRGVVEGLPQALAALRITSDLQGREDAPEDRLLGILLAEHLDDLVEKGDLPPADKIGAILAGDLYGVPGSTKRGGGGDVTEVWRAFAQRFRWVTGVLGNHDHITLEEMPDQATILDSDLLECDEMKIAGLSGIIGDPKRPNRKSAEDFSDSVELLAAENPDILVLHQGPDQRPNPDPTVGNALRKGRDLFVVCGHAPWKDPLLELSEDIQVLNVDARVVVLFPQK